MEQDQLNLLQNICLSTTHRESNITTWLPQWCNPATLSYNICTVIKPIKNGLYLWLGWQSRLGFSVFLQEGYQESISWYRLQDSKHTALCVGRSSKLTIATFHTVSMDTGEVLLRSYASFLSSFVIRNVHRYNWAKFATRIMKKLISMHLNKVCDLQI